MKRKLVWVGLSWFAGLCAATAFGSPLESTLTLCLLPAAWLLLGAVRLWKRIRTSEMLTIGISYTAAFCAVLLYTLVAYTPAMALDGTATTFSGKVTQVTIYDNDRAAYQVKGEFADGTDAKILVYTSDVGAEYGDILDVAGIFTVPEDTYLWSGESYYRAKGIFLEASDDAYVVCTETDSGGLVRTLQAYRERIALRITTLTGTEAGGMVNAMLLGDKTSLSETTEDAFSQNGILHVLSVSGLHLVLLLSVWTSFCKRVHMHRIPAFLGSAVGTVLYAILVGTPVSVLRAGFMFLLVQSAPLFYRKANTLNSLCLAGILLTLPNPYLIQDSSFLLSMAGTFGIGVWAPWMTKRMTKKGFPYNILRKLVSMTCVSLCVFPVTLMFFEEVSLLSPISNIFLVPIASCILLLSLLVLLTGGVGFIAKPVCFLMHLLYDFLMLLANGMQNMVSLTFPAGDPLLPVLCVILGLFVLLAYAIYKKPRAVALASAISFAILLGGQAVYRAGEKSCFLITVMGRSDEMVVVLSYQDRTDVIDMTGHYKNPSYVSQFLTENGISSIDSLCLTDRAAQLRVTYTQTLTGVTASSAVVPTDCPLPTGATACGAEITQADAFQITDTAYTATYQDETLLVTYGTLTFYIGTDLSALPDTDLTACVCTSWEGDVDVLPEQAYVKEETLQIRVTSQGTWSVETLS